MIKEKGRPFTLAEMADAAAVLIAVMTSPSIIFNGIIVFVSTITMPSMNLYLHFVTFSTAAKINFRSKVFVIGRVSDPEYFVSLNQCGLDWVRAHNITKIKLQDSVTVQN